MDLFSLTERELAIYQAGFKDGFNHQASVQAWDSQVVEAEQVAHLTNFILDNDGQLIPAPWTYPMEEYVKFLYDSNKQHRDASYKETHELTLMDFDLSVEEMHTCPIIIYINDDKTLSQIKVLKSRYDIEDTKAKLREIFGERINKTQFYWNHESFGG